MVKQNNETTEIKTLTHIFWMSVPQNLEWQTLLYVINRTTKIISDSTQGVLTILNMLQTIITASCTKQRKKNSSYTAQFWNHIFVYQLTNKKKRYLPHTRYTVNQKQDFSMISTGSKICNLYEPIYHEPRVMSRDQMEDSSTFFSYGKQLQCVIIGFIKMLIILLHNWKSISFVVQRFSR